MWRAVLADCGSESSRAHDNKVAVKPPPPFPKSSKRPLSLEHRKAMIELAPAQSNAYGPFQASSDCYLHPASTNRRKYISFGFKFCILHSLLIALKVKDTLSSFRAAILVAIQSTTR